MYITIHKLANWS